MHVVLLQHGEVSLVRLRAIWMTIIDRKQVPTI